MAFLWIAKYLNVVYTFEGTRSTGREREESTVDSMSQTDVVSMAILAMITALNVGISIGLLMNVLSVSPSLQLFALVTIEFAAVIFVYHRSRQQMSMA